MRDQERSLTLERTTVEDLHYDIRGKKDELRELSNASSANQGDDMVRELEEQLRELEQELARLKSQADRARTRSPALHSTTHHERPVSAIAGGAGADLRYE